MWLGEVKEGLGLDEGCVVAVWFFGLSDSGFNVSSRASLAGVIDGSVHCAKTGKREAFSGSYYRKALGALVDTGVKSSHGNIQLICRHGIGHVACSNSE